MADKKISDLTAASTPLAGTEVLPIVQSSTTKKVSIADITAGRAISATSVTATTGSFVVGTSGQGVDFSATPGAAGMTSELLNDYEEGTWTPDFSNWTTAPTLVSATYTKVGRQVTVIIYAYNGVTNFSRIAGLPFTASANAAGAGVLNSSSAWAIKSGCSVLPSGTVLAGVETGNITGVFWQLCASYFT